MFKVLMDFIFISIHEFDLRSHISSSNKGDNFKEKRIILSAPLILFNSTKTRLSFHRLFTHSYLNFSISSEARENAVLNGKGYKSLRNKLGMKPP